MRKLATLLCLTLLSSCMPPRALATQMVVKNECNKPYYRDAFGSTAPTHKARLAAFKADKGIDFYTGLPLKIDAFDADHVRALGDTWGTSCSWTIDKRVLFANDLINLHVTTASINRGKGQQSPATWSPANRNYSCRYGKLYITVSKKWDIPVTKIVRDTVKKHCEPYV